MELAHTSDDGLSGFLVGVGLEGGVLLRQLDEADSHLLLAGLGLGLNSHPDNGLRELHGLQNDGMLFVAEGISGGGVLQADDRSDVAGVHGLNILPVVGVHLEDAANALLLLLRGVEHLGAGIQGTGIDTNKGQTAHIRIGGDLKGQGGKGRVVRRRTLLLLFRVGVEALDSGNIGGSGHIVHDGIQHLLHALIFVGRAAGDGDHFVSDGGLADGGADLVLRDLLAVQIQLGNLVVKHRDGVHQLLVVLVGKVQHVGGDLLHPHVLAQVVIIDVRVHLHQVDDALKGLLASDGKLDGHGIALQALLHHVEHVVKVRAHDVHLVNIDHPGDLIGVRLTPDGLGLGLHAALGAQNSHGTVQNAQGTLHFHGEVHVARGIDDIDTSGLELVFGTRPVAGGGGGRNGDAALLFLGHPVHRGGTVVGLADFIVHAGVEQDPLGGRGLARVDVSHNADVSGVFKRCFSRHT